MSYIYLASAILFIASQFIFHSRILSFGAEIRGAIAAVIKFSLILIPLYLYFNLGLRKKSAFYLALFFHSFFIVNAFLMALEKYGFWPRPILRVAGVFGPLEYSFKQTAVIFLNFILNFAILSYIIRKKKLFLTSN